MKLKQLFAPLAPHTYFCSIGAESQRKGVTDSFGILCGRVLRILDRRQAFGDHCVVSLFRLLRMLLVEENIKGSRQSEIIINVLFLYKGFDGLDMLGLKIR